MKKKILSLVVAMVAATASYAQSSLVATLNHENTISVFHGQSAFADAMDAAANGDIITLNSGVYSSTDITKAVTLRGSGVEEDKQTGQYITQVNGTCNLDIEDGAGQKLSIEGINFSGKLTIKNGSGSQNASWNKCKISQFTVSGSTNSNCIAKDWTFTNCFITKSINFAQGSNVSFVNCRVWKPTASTTDSKVSTMAFTNCIVICKETSGFQTSPGLYNSKFENCFIFKTSTNASSKGLPVSDEAYNCVGYDASGSNPVFGSINQNTNIELTSEEYNSLFKEDTFYELTDEAKAKYIGTDNREVGLYGGVLPYSTHIVGPQITKCNVAQKTTNDGKLSVDIEVKAAE